MEKILYSRAGRVRIACWIPKSINTHTHTEYVILIDFALHQLLPHHVTVLCYTCIACFVIRKVVGKFSVVHSGLSEVSTNLRA